MISLLHVLFPASVAQKLALWSNIKKVQCPDHQSFKVLKMVSCILPSGLKHTLIWCHIWYVIKMCLTLEDETIPSYGYRKRKGNRIESPTLGFNGTPARVAPCCSLNSAQHTLVANQRLSKHCSKEGVFTQTGLYPWLPTIQMPNKKESQEKT